MKVQVDGSFVNLAVQPDLDRDLFANVKNVLKIEQDVRLIEEKYV